MNYILHILILVNIYAALGMSLNLLTGYTGLVSLCHAAFFSIGAYSTAILMVDFNLGFGTALICSILITAAFSLAVGIPSLRLQGDYFILATLAFQLIVFGLLYNCVSLTRGPYGIPGIPKTAVFAIVIDSQLKFFLLASFLLIGEALLMWLLLHSPFGRVLKAIREDEISVASLGKNVARTKIQAFALAASFAAVPGAVFALYFRYIDPSSFTLMDSIFILSIVIIGGAGSFMGPLAGAILLITLPEGLRFLDIPTAAAANLRQIIYGILLMCMMRFRPKGFFGDYGFD